MNIRVSSNKKEWTVILNGRIAARFSKDIYTEQAALTYASGLCIEVGMGMGPSAEE